MNFRKAVYFLAPVSAALVFWLLMGKPGASFSLPQWQGGNLAQNIQPGGRSPEVYLCENMTVVNWLNWRRGVAVNLSVTAKTDKQHRAELARLVDRHAGQIKDNIRVVVGSLRPEHIRDPHLRYVKANIRLGLPQEIHDKKLIQDIFIPEWHAAGSF